MTPEQIVMRASMVAAACLGVILLSGCAAPAPECNSINPYHPCHRWADQGAGGMAQKAAPGISNNPGGLSGGGPVGGKSPGKGGHKGHGGKHGGKSHGK